MYTKIGQYLQNNPIENMFRDCFHHTKLTKIITLLFFFLGFTIINLLILLSGKILYNIPEISKAIKPIQCFNLYKVRRISIIPGVVHTSDLILHAADVIIIMFQQIHSIVIQAIQSVKKEKWIGPHFLSSV